MSGKESDENNVEVGDVVQSQNPTLERDYTEDPTKRKPLVQVAPKLYKARIETGPHASTRVLRPFKITLENGEEAIAVPFSRYDSNKYHHKLSSTIRFNKQNGEVEVAIELHNSKYGYFIREFVLVPREHEPLGYAVYQKDFRTKNKLRLISSLSPLMED
jgi:hypothetical protein